jgi:DNA-binding response OmpR family regulator
MLKKPAKLLYVEDDETLRFITAENLERKGYSVTQCNDGEEAFARYHQSEFDICVFDVMLPKLDGFSLAKMIRRENLEIPIIFVTAKSLTDDKIEGLLLGADDYIVKPFSIEELILKIEIFLKRSRINIDVTTDDFYIIGNYTLNFRNLILRKGKNEKKITYREAELLRYFYLNRDKLLSREEILINIWGENDYFAGRSLDVFISRIRKHFKDDDSVSIENRHGVGFVFRIE